MKRIIALSLISILCLACLSSCEIIDKFKAMYDDFYSHGTESLTMVQEFTVALAAKNYDKAMTYLHPSSNLKREDLEDMMSSISTKKGISFNKGIEFKNPSFNITPMTDGNANIIQTQYSVIFTLVVGEAELSLSSIVLQDQSGFGILTYNLV